MPRGLLTKADLKKLAKVPPGGRMRFLPDKAVGGLGVIWGARDKPSWTLAYRDNTRKQHRVKLGLVWDGAEGQEPTPEYLGIEAARRRAYEIKEAARGGVLPQVSSRGSAKGVMTVGEAIELYLDDPDTRARKSHYEIGRILRKDAPALVGKPIAKVTTDDIWPVLEAKGRTPAANRLHSTLSGFFKWANGSKRKLIRVSPMPAERPLSKEKKRNRVLSDDELTRVWRATEKRPVERRGVVQMLILSGQRREEVAGMKWCELDLTKEIWNVAPERYKTDIGGSPHVLPLTDAMIEIINSQKPIKGSDYVFTVNGRNSVSMEQEGQELKKAVGELSGGPWVLHDLRRTFRTGLANLKVDKRTADLLYHPEGGSGGVYDRHRYLDEKRDALELWGRHVRSILS